MNGILLTSNSVTQHVPFSAGCSMDSEEREQAFHISLWSFHVPSLPDCVASLRGSFVSLGGAHRVPEGPLLVSPGLWRYDSPLSLTDRVNSVLDRLQPEPSDAQTVRRLQRAGGCREQAAAESRRLQRAGGCREQAAAESRRLQRAGGRA
ncbi:hypothetical protein EYF80_037956 [Liparis tanakae]|uniref:Uncharacterized protein n=1 Tax=Liparis tanakae TaxID=230148 RepID=A0A4Z2GF01_9TELE|nr:hypothetical protein EYF80_037956 [Liparis tanakae]